MKPAAACRVTHSAAAATYAAEYKLSELEAVAGKTKVMADEFIADSNSDITGAFVDYLKPLLGSGMGEPYRLEADRVEKILDT